MPIKILMPALSPTMKHGTIASWNKKEGNIVESGDVIAEIETDKATMEVEAADEGVLYKILTPAGSKSVDVNSPIAILKEEGDSDEDVNNFIEDLQGETAKEENIQINDNETNDQENDQVNGRSDNQTDDQDDNSSNSNNIKSSQIESSHNKKQFASPLAKKLANINNVDLNQITNGSGPNGRIVKNDIVNFVNNSNNHNNDNSNDNIIISQNIIRDPNEAKIVECTPMQKAIAKKLVTVKQNIPHFYLSISCVMDDLLNARSVINKKLPNKSQRISVNDLIIMATSKAIKQIPDINCSFENDQLSYYNNIDIAFAVAIDGGLITPIVQNADQKNIHQIAAETKSYISKAKNNSLTREEYQGPAITISNLGMYGVENFQAIINPPASSILSIGAIIKKAIVHDDQIMIKNIMQINISCDHRAINGDKAAQFLKIIKSYLEQPILMFT